MKTIVIHKTKYGSTKVYAEWIAEDLGCDVFDAKDVNINKLSEYDTIIYGGGLYAEVINGVHFITKNFDKLKDKNLIVFTTGITPLDCREYYDKMIIEKNFKPHMVDKIKTFNYLGKMKMDELSFVHRAALKTLKKIMAGKENPTEMEKMLIDLCDVDADLSDRGETAALVDYVKRIG